jgi:hypothetical protein
MQYLIKSGAVHHEGVGRVATTRRPIPATGIVHNFLAVSYLSAILG